MPSFAMMGAITRAATESDHHQPSKKFNSRPATSAAERYVQNCVCCESAIMAGLPTALPTLRFARASSGITKSAATPTAMPSRLRSGPPLCQREYIESITTYAASARKQSPTTLRLIPSARSRCSACRSAFMRQSRAEPEITSMKLSRPNPIKAILPAEIPAPTDSKPSTLFQRIVKYSRRTPR